MRTLALEALADGLTSSLAIAANLRIEDELAGDDWLILSVVLAEAARCRTVDVDLSLGELVHHVLLHPRGGLARHRVRAALKRLDERGIVAYRPGTGTRCSRVSLLPFHLARPEYVAPDVDEGRTRP